MKKYLNAKHPASFGGVDRFSRGIGDIKKEKAKEVLENLDEYSINKEARKKFQRNPIQATNLQQQYQLDLADVKKHKDRNDGVQYLLIAVDCFSRKVSVVPLKDKSGKEVKQALVKVFAELGEPDSLQTDKGKEFYNSVVKQYLTEHQVKLFSSENSDIKCAMAERFIRTLKSRMYRMFRNRVDTRYIDKLQDLVHSYNHSIHSAHGMRPVDVTQDNSLLVYNRLRSKLRRRKPKYAVGQHVRISVAKSIFTKGYEYRFTEQLYVITKVIPHLIPMYEVKDLQDEPIKGKFYESELSLVRNADNLQKEFVVDKVLKETKKRYFVSWVGYGPEHNSWIDKNALRSPFLHHAA